MPDPVGGLRAVTEDQTGRAGGDAVLRQRLHEHPDRAGARGRYPVIARVVLSGRPRDQQVHPRRDPVHPRRREVLGECGVAPGPLARPDPPHVALQLPRRDQPGM